MDSPAVTNQENFRQRVRQSFTGAAANLVLRAYDCAGERFGTGLAERVRVADILLRQRADHIVVTAALLASLRRHGCIEASEIRSLFGEVPAGLVEKVFSEKVLRTDTEVHRKEDVRLFLESISDDIRTLILQIGLRLAELEKIAGQDGNDHRNIARETLELYVPLTGRMGMGGLRTQLEDVCFRILEPAIYEELAQNVEPIRAEDNVCLELLKVGVKRLLRRNGVKGTVYGRAKGLYSIHRKMNRLGCSLEEIMDKIGLRIIVSSVEKCYAVLGLLHTHFRPVPGTFDDYIGLPKENGYQSLHTCVYPVPDISHKPVEFQIRTEAMHWEAEFGVAAHWLYKSGEETKVSSDRQLQWLRGLLSHHERSASHAEFIEHLHRQVFDDRLVVFDAAGQPIRLPAGTTVRNFAGQFSRSNGLESIVRVNGVVRPSDYPLRDGDTVELIVEETCVDGGDGIIA